MDNALSTLRRNGKRSNVIAIVSSSSTRSEEVLVDDDALAKTGYKAVESIRECQN